MSTIKVGTLLHSDGSTTTQPSIPALDKRMAKAWVNFKEEGGRSIRSSYNVSSITDNGTGDHTANFTVAMGSIPCSLATTGGTTDSGRNDAFAVVLVNLTTSCRIRIHDISSGLSDIQAISILSFSN